MKKMMMIVAMIATVLSANAQYEPGTFSIQPKIGFNIASLTNAEKLPISAGVNIDREPIFGGLAGVEAEYQLMDLLGLSAGVHFSEQGQAWKDFKQTINGVSTELKETQMYLGYVNVPIIANIYLYKGLAFKTGVQFGFLAIAELQYRVEGRKTSEMVS